MLPEALGYFWEWKGYAGGIGRPSSSTKTRIKMWGSNLLQEFPSTKTCAQGIRDRRSSSRRNLGRHLQIQRTPSQILFLHHKACFPCVVLLITYIPIIQGQGVLSKNPGLKFCGRECPYSQQQPEHKRPAKPYVQDEDNPLVPRFVAESQVGW